MGLGHFIRSSALAAMLKNDFEVVLATQCTLEPLLEQARSVFASVVLLPQGDASAEIAALSKKFNRDSLLVLDGYQFDTAYQQCLFEKGFVFFCIDDIHAYPFLATTVINHAGGFSPHDYKAQAETQFYLGPRYALLRQPFLSAAATRRTAITDNNCFVCYGGADPDNRTLALLKEMRSQKWFETVHVVIGSAYQYKNELETFLSENPGLVLHTALSPDEMVAVMQLCSFAICSPSTIVYEFMSVGGVVFLDQIADNQKDVIRYFTAEGMAFPLNRVGILTEEEIATALQKQGIYFDGRSGERFRKLFRQYFDAQQLSIRRAQPADVMVCFEWANDPEVRAQSYNQNTIPLEAHKNWFATKLQDKTCFYYIFETGGEPVAQIRFQCTNGEAVLGYLVSKKIRREGLGTAILAKGIAQLLQDAGEPLTIIGHVKKENIASQRSFEKLAFRKSESTSFPDSFTYTMNYGN